MTQQVLSPKEKAAELILLALTINPDLSKSKAIAMKIANLMSAVPNDVEDYISDVLYAIDNTEI